MGARLTRSSGCGKIVDKSRHPMIVKRCGTCGRFRSYEESDQFCIGCGHDGLTDACACGRPFDYALTESGPELHCPRCGTRLRGRAHGVE